MDRAAEEALTRRLHQIAEQVRLDEYEIRVLKHRMWCRVTERKTLSEIAETLRLSRERVRLLDQSALDKLRSERLLNEFRGILAERTKAIWLTLTSGKARLPKEAVRDGQHNLSANDVFLLLALYGTVENWITSIAIERPRSWELPGVAPRRSHPLHKPGPSTLPAGILSWTQDDLRYVMKLVQRKEELLSQLQRVDQAIGEFQVATS